MDRAPGRSWRHRLRPAWIVPGICLLTLGAALAVRVARPSLPGKEAHRRAAMEAAAQSAAFADLLARLRQEPNPTAFTQARAGRDDSEAMAELIQAYAAWASRGDALDARRLIVKTFIENPSLKV